jgi:hypothetical protein
MKEISFATFLLIAGGASAGRAEAVLQNAVSAIPTITSSSPAGMTSLFPDKTNSNTTFTLASQLPVGPSYSEVNVEIRFMGVAGLFDGGICAPGPKSCLNASERLKAVKF